MIEPNVSTGAEPDLYEQLMSAIERDGAGCANNDDFIADGTHAATVADICARCPVLSKCYAYAAEARPRAGIWAGQRWTSRRKTT